MCVTQNFFVPVVRRLCLSVVPLTLAACQPQYDDGLAQNDEIRAQAAQSSSTVEEAAGSIPPDSFVQHQIERSLAERQYELVLEWFRREGLRDRSHAELVILAETDAAASKYIECHQVSKTPTGLESRLELLSTCLTQDPSADSTAATGSLSVANVCVQTKTEVDALPPDCPAR